MFKSYKKCAPPPQSNGVAGVGMSPAPPTFATFYSIRYKSSTRVFNFMKTQHRSAGDMYLLIITFVKRLTIRRVPITSQSMVYHYIMIHWHIVLLFYSIYLIPVHNFVMILNVYNELYTVHFLSTHAVCIYNICKYNENYLGKFLMRIFNFLFQENVHWRS